jgi:WD40 repeat protein
MDRLPWFVYLLALWYAHTAFAFSPDGKTLASGYADGVIRLWKAAVGIPVPLLGHTDGVNAVAFSLNGKLLASDIACTNASNWNAGV